MENEPIDGALEALLSASTYDEAHDAATRALREAERDPHRALARVRVLVAAIAKARSLDHAALPKSWQDRIAPPLERARVLVGSSVGKERLVSALQACRAGHGLRGGAQHELRRTAASLLDDVVDMPETLEDAVRRVLADLSGEDARALAAAHEDDFGELGERLGYRIRNSYGLLWLHNQALLRACGRRTPTTLPRRS